MRSDDALVAKFAALWPHLDERQRRLVMGAEARALGRGGITAVARATGTSPVVVSRGVSELDAGEGPLGRARRPGGGRKPVTVSDPGLGPALLSLTSSTPEGPLRWTTATLRQMAQALTGAGHAVSAPTVAKLLRVEGFSLRTNARPTAGGGSRDWDAQFRHINDQARDHLRRGDPVVSVQTRHSAVSGADVDGMAVGRHTAVFTVATLRTWWRASGAATHPRAKRLLIALQGGAATDDRLPVELSEFADETAMTVTVCHFPPGASKWAAVTNRMSVTVEVLPPGSTGQHEVTVAAIEADQRPVAISTPIDAPWCADSGADVLRRHAFRGDWNYSLVPRPR